MLAGPPYDVFAKIREAEHENNLEVAYGLIKTYTYNEQWASHVLEAAGSSSGIQPMEHDLWVASAAAEYIRISNGLRQEQQRAMAAQDLTKLGQLYLAEGHLLTLRGLYRQAYRIYQSARSSNPRIDTEGLLWISHLDILQQNWALVETSVGKHLLSIKEDHNEYFLPLCANFAISTWCQGNFADTFAALVHSEPRPSSPWIEGRHICFVLVLCALTSLDRSAISASFCRDPVFAELASQPVLELVDAYLELEIPRFWDIFNELEAQLGTEFIVAKSIEPAKLSVRRRMQQEWLSVYARCRLSKALSIFAYPYPQEGYDIFAFIEDLDGKQVCIDTVTDTFEIGRTGDEDEELAEKLAHEFMTDSVMLYWADVAGKLSD